MAGEYESAETALLEAVEAQESDFVETLRYLGASQYAQGNYGDAVATFRKAVAVRGDDGVLLNWLGLALHEVAEWGEAEEVKRRFLTISVRENGQDHPQTATAMNNLASLLKATNRLDEAEPLMRRALQIDQASYGDQHPKVAIRLNNLASLLKATNRLDEAEPLMRRALQIFEASLGESHPNTHIVQGNLTALLSAIAEQAPPPGD